MAFHQKARTLSLNGERFFSSKNREQFAILTKQKTLTRYKSAFYSMKKGEQRSPFAEREGFEPPVPLGTTVFKTVVIDHSTISPMLLQIVVSKASAKVGK